MPNDVELEEYLQCICSGKEDNLVNLILNVEIEVMGCLVNNVIKSYTIDSRLQSKLIHARPLLP